MKTRTVLILLFSMHSLLTFGQSTNADSTKYFYILSKDTILTEPDFSKLSGKFEKIRRQFYTLKNPLFCTKFDSVSKKSFVTIDTLLKQDIFDYPLVEGFYENGIKSGKWSIIHDYGSNYSFCHQLYFDYYLTYRKDSIIKDAFFPKTTLREAISIESSLINGFLEFENKERVNFECSKSKNQCIFWVHRKKDLFEKTAFDNLTVTLRQIENGDYNRKIIKNYH